MEKELRDACASSHMRGWSMSYISIIIW